ncbi:MAG: AMP-binding protein [Rummeliibacillus sp.]
MQKMKYENLQEIIIQWKDVTDKGIEFIDSEKRREFMSYKNIYETALSYLGALHEKGLKENDMLVFQFDDNKKFVLIFWACVLGRIIPVPLATVKAEEYFEKMFRIGKILEKSHAIFEQTSHKTFLSVAQKKAEAFEEMKQNITFLHFEELNPKEAEIKQCLSEDIAFIQFTSGSTGNPKGVVLRHRNLVANIEAILRGAEVTDADTSLSWMPLSHDMGLIGFHLSPYAIGINQYLMQTNTFVLNPLLWMKVASEYKVSVLASPNFGYTYYLNVLKRKKDATVLDLSNVRVIFNGAEPISIDVCEEFLNEMHPYGLRMNVMFTVYGLAEACLAVAFPKVEEELNWVTVDRRHLGIGAQVVFCEAETGIKCAVEGRPVKHCEIAIRDELGNVLEENRVGYICIKGKNVTEGFFHDTETTSKIIDEAGWLNTFDLGFIHEAQLIVTGRAKDVIFSNGVNLYSSDLESVVSGVDNIPAGKVAVCACAKENNADDDIVVFVATKWKQEELLEKIDQIKTSLWIKTGVQVKAVIPVKTIPKTTSGKIQHYKLSEQYLNHAFDKKVEEIQRYYDERKAMNSSAEHTETEKKLIEIYQSILEIDAIDIDENIANYGADSLKLTQLFDEIRNVFSKEMNISNVFEYYTIRKMAQYIEQSDEKLPGIEFPENLFLMKPSKHRFSVEQDLSELGCDEGCVEKTGIAFAEIWMELLDGMDVLHFYYHLESTDEFKYICIQNMEYDSIKNFLTALKAEIEQSVHVYSSNMLTAERKNKNDYVLYLCYSENMGTLSEQTIDFFDYFAGLNDGILTSAVYSKYFDKELCLRVMNGILELIKQI